mmetsp:Transcript_2288/g.7065  ORF Transcript_2288/g.7065 Transcript_2288/m.7065 type:complete len:261 (-) Transcript_2288:314-1096(-)
MEEFDPLLVWLTHPLARTTRAFNWAHRSDEIQLAYICPILPYYTLTKRTTLHCLNRFATLLLGKPLPIKPVCHGVIRGAFQNSADPAQLDDVRPRSTDHSLEMPVFENVRNSPLKQKQLPSPAQVAALNLVVREVDAALSSKTWVAKRPCNGELLASHGLCSVNLATQEVPAPESRDIGIRCRQADSEVEHALHFAIPRAISPEQGLSAAMATQRELEDISTVRARRTALLCDKEREELPSVIPARDVPDPCGVTALQPS